MDSHFDKVRDYLLELSYEIAFEDQAEGIFMVNNTTAGIHNAVIIVNEPMVIVEQFLFEIETEDASIFKNLLMKNRDIIHGAFVLDETGKRLLFRNTHECENLDLNELEATLNSLSLLLGEYAHQLIQYSQKSSEQLQGT